MLIRFLRFQLVRNDALYKATTTTTTTTTTQAPPPTTEAPYRRPAMRNRPYRRRRPQPDYYYDEEEYDDDYMDEPMNRRRRPNRPRPRRPEYDDEYDNPRGGYKDETHDDDLYDQRSAPRSRPRDQDDMDDYEYDRRPYDRPRSRARPGNKRRYNDDEPTDKRPSNQGRQFAENDRRKGYAADGRRGTQDDKKSSLDDRKSLTEDRKGSINERRPAYDDRDVSRDDGGSNTDDSGRRPHNDRHRPNSSRRRPSYDDDVDMPPKKQSDYHHQDAERDRGHRPAAQEDKVEIVPKVRASSSSGSIFNRPRAPPRISRPVPVSEKNKYQYTANKQPTPAAAPKPTEEEMYDDDYDYEAEPAKPHPIKIEEKTEVKSSPVVSSQKEQKAPPPKDSPPPSKKPVEEEYEEYEDDPPATYEKPQPPQPVPASPLKLPERNNYQLPEPAKPKVEVTEKPTVAPKEEPKGDSEFYDEEEIEYIDEEEPLENNEPAHSGAKAPQPPPVTAKPVLLSGETQQKAGTPTLYGNQAQKPDITGPSAPASSRNKYQRPPGLADRISSRITAPGTSTAPEDTSSYSRRDPLPENIRPSGFKMNANNDPEPSLTLQQRTSDQDEATLRQYHPVVRVLKRPFLPSRGGNPYLARGLKPLGGNVADNDPSEVSPIDQHHPTASGIRSDEHSPLTIRKSPYDNHPIQTGPRTTQQPQIEPPRSTLDDLYNEEYDVTLNDALNPTLKPLSQPRGSPIGFSQTKYNPYARVDVAYSPSQLRTSVNHAQNTAQSRPLMRRYQGQPTAQEYYRGELNY